MSSRNVALAIFVFGLSLTWPTTLWDRDEPRFAQASIEMVRSGNYLVPTLRGDVRAQKPILIYWLMALSIGILGAGEIGARFWAPVGLAVTAYAAWSIGRRLISPRVGLLAMPIVALNPLAMLEGTAATTDAVLMALVSCALAAFVWRLTSAAALAPAVMFAAALAGALLTKGPVGLLPLLVAAGTLWARRAQPGTKRIALEFGLAAAAAGALFAVWALPANTAAGGRFVTQGILHDVVDRVLLPLEGHGGNLLVWAPFYPAVLAIGFAPWSAYVPAALYGLWRRDGARSDATWVLTWWIAGPFVAFSLAATHLPHYILPAWPALSLAVACVVDAGLAGKDDASMRRWLAFGVPIACVSTGAALAALVAAPFVLRLPGLVWRSIAIAVAIVISSVFFVRALWRADHRRAAFICLASVVVSEALVGFWWLPAIEAVKPVPRIAAAIRERAGASASIASFAFEEPSLDFYLGRTPDRLEDVNAVRAWSRILDPGVLVTTRTALHVADQPPSLHEIASSRGFNVANGQHVELVALERRGQ